MAADAKKTDAKGKGETVLDDRQKRHERLTLVLFLEGAVAIVAGMFLISEFLSRGEAERNTLIVTGVLTGIFAVGFAVTYFLRRRSDNA